jgi:hypothetical protein
LARAPQAAVSISTLGGPRYPVVVINAANSPNSFVAHQEIFHGCMSCIKAGDALIANIMEPTSFDANVPWQIPFRYGLFSPSGSIISQSIVLGTTPVTLFTSTSPANSQCSFLKGNIGQVGVYRVQYPTDVWQQIIGCLKLNATIIPSVDRAGLIDDVFELSRAGRVDITIALSMSTYLVNETGQFCMGNRAQPLCDNLIFFFSFLSNRLCCLASSH